MSAKEEYLELLRAQKLLPHPGRSESIAAARTFCRLEALEAFAESIALAVAQTTPDPVLKSALLQARQTWKADRSPSL